MNETLTVIAIILMYLGTMMGMISFLAFVCGVGDLGLMFLGWIDNKIQNLPQRNKA